MNDWMSRLRPLLVVRTDEPVTEEQPSDLACGLVFALLTEATAITALRQGGSTATTRRFRTRARDLDGLAAHCLLVAGSIDFRLLEAETRSGEPFLLDVEDKIDEVFPELIVEGVGRVLGVLSDAGRVAQEIARDNVEESARRLVDLLCEAAALCVLAADALFMHDA